MNSVKVSMFMLERYRLGELNSEDQKNVNEALLKDENLRSSLEILDESDRELRLQYPADQFIAEIAENNTGKADRHEGVKIRRFKTKRTVKSRIRFTGVAAVLMVCILLPVLYFTRVIQGGGSGQELGGIVSPLNSAQADIPTGTPIDRAKGSVGVNYELALYLKDQRDLLQENLLENQVVLGQGSTVQLAYTIPAGEQYGVIFSIDGRSEVTMHYPYRKGQSSLLVSGRRTFLNEAYTLDDAPDYELFVFVVSDKPLDVEAVLDQARTIAEQKRIGELEDGSRAAFPGCEVETLTVIKK